MVVGFVVARMIGMISVGVGVAVVVDGTSLLPHVIDIDIVADSYCSSYSEFYRY